MDRSRFDMQVAAFRDDPSLEVPLCTEAARLGCKIHIFEAPGRFNPSAVSKLREFIKTHGIQILHTHWYKTDIIGLLATVGTKCRIVTTPHGWSREPDFKLWCYEILDRAVFPFFDGVVPLSQDLYEALASSTWYTVLSKLTNKRLPDSPNQRLNESTTPRLPGSTNLLLIANGVDISEIDAVTEVAPEIVNLRSQGVFVVGYIGQLIHRKGLDILLEAAARLPKSLNWHLVVIGDGGQRSDLEKRALKAGIASKVHFLGYRQDRISLLKGFHVFALPSRLEGIPRCLMEAMAARVPVIASDIPGCNDLVADQETGILFPVNDAQALAERIGEIAVNKRLQESLTRTARKFIEENFSAERMAKEYEALYMKIAQS